jgi:para-nitrobenzyl esterase
MGPNADAMTDSDLTAQATAMLGDARRAEQAIGAYRRARPHDPPFYLLVGLVTDRQFTAPSILIAERQGVQVPTYMYQTTWRMPSLGGRLRAAHAVDMALAFDNAGLAVSMLGDGPEPEALGKIISGAFASFARTGDPTTPLAPVWPGYSHERRETMLFDVPPSVVRDPGPDERLFWNGAAA